MIIPAPASIRDTISNNDKTSTFSGGPRLQRLNEPPMLLRRHRITGDVLLVDLVAGAVPAVDARAGVARDVVAGLAVLQVDGDGEFGLRGDVEVERVGDGETLVGDRDGAVATSALVNDRNIARGAVVLHRRKHVIRPSVIMIIPAPTSIRNTVADDHEARGFSRGPRLQSLNEPPMLLRRRIRARDVLLIDLVTRAVPAIHPAAWVSRDVVAGLTVLKVDGNRQLRLRFDVEIERVRDGKALVGDRDGSVAGECDVLYCGGLNQGGACAWGIGGADDGAV